MIDDDLNNLSDDELARLEKMLDIVKLQQEIQNGHEINMATIEKMRAETAKMEKEARYYPWVLLLSSMVGGLVVFLLTQYFK